jgi:hypothetical protein
VVVAVVGTPASGGPGGVPPPVGAELLPLDTTELLFDDFDAPLVAELTTDELPVADVVDLLLDSLFDDPVPASALPVTDVLEELHPS